MRRWPFAGFALVVAATPIAAAQDAEPESIWTFLVDKYDADADGAVSAEEYGRDTEKFARLDRDGDGALTAADFERGGGGRRGGRSPRTDPATMAAMVVGRYLAGDADLDGPTLATAFATYDADADGRIVRAEFDAEAAARGASPGMDRFQMLLDALDDGDGALTLAELRTWFDARDGDSDGVLTLDEMGVRSRGGRPGRERGGRRGRDAGSSDADPAREGAVAPDFSLRPPQGGDAVTLSSFAGKRPVALIFGSYT